MSDTKTLKEIYSMKGIGQYNVLRGAVIQHVKPLDTKSKEAVSAAVNELRSLIAEAVEKGNGDLTLTIANLFSGEKPASTKAAAKKKVVKKAAVKKKASKKASKGLGGDVLLTSTGSVSIKNVNDTHVGKVLQAPIDLMVPVAWHPRFDKGDLSAYAKFIGEHWPEFQELLDPMPVVIFANGKHTTIEVADGMRSAQAIHLALSKGYLKTDRIFLPVRIYGVVKEEGHNVPQYILRELIQAQAYRAASKNLHPAELSNLLITATEQAGMEVKDISGFLGIPQKRARQLLLLASASDAVKSAFDKGDIQDSDLVGLMKGCKNNHKEQDARLHLALAPPDGKEEDPVRSGKKERVLLKRSVLQGSGVINERQARSMLNSLATQYSRFRRGGLGRRQENEEWDALNNLLLQIRNLKAAGRIQT